MLTSDFRPKVEIWPFRACTMKIMQYNAYLCPNFGNSCVIENRGRGIRWLWGRHHVPQNVFLVEYGFDSFPVQKIPDPDEVTRDGFVHCVTGMGHKMNQNLHFGDTYVNGLACVTISTGLD